MKTLATGDLVSWAILIPTFFGGIYGLIHSLFGGHTAAGAVLIEVLTSDISGVIWSVLVVVGSLLVFYGLIKRHVGFCKNGWFILISCRLLQVLGMIVLMGWTPIVWVYPLTIMLVMIVLYIRNA